MVCLPIRILGWGVRLRGAVILVAQLTLPFRRQASQPLFFLVNLLMHFLFLETDLIASAIGSAGIPAINLPLLYVELLHAGAFVLFVVHGAHDKAGLTAEGNDQGHQDKEMGLVLESGLARGMHKSDKVREAGHRADQANHD